MSSVHFVGRSFAIRTGRSRDTHRAITQIPGATWDNVRGYYRVPLESRAFLHTVATAHNMEISEEAAPHLAPADLPSAREVLIPDLDAPLASGRILYAHQKEGVRFLVRRRRAILADQMGLGKTTTALVAAAVFHLPIHVICPVSLKGNWHNEAEALGIFVHTHSWAKIPAHIDGQFVLICDEAHYAQSGTKSQRGAAFLKLSGMAAACFLLSGTPMKNGRPANLLPLLKAVQHPIARNKGWFEKRYCDAKATPWSRWDTSGASHLEELHDRVKDAMLRRLKDECLDLPAKTRVMRQAERTTAAVDAYTDAYDRALDRYRAKHASNEDLFPEPDPLVRVTFRRMAASMAKVEAAVAIVTDLFEEYPDASVVLFTEYLESAGALARAFKGSLLLTGATPPEERTGMVRQFQLGESRVFVSTIRAGGVGLTLTRAQTVILVDRPWTPGDAAQAEDRLHRIGQHSAVLSIWLQWDELDTAVDQLLDTKHETIEVVLAGRRRTLRQGMSERQLVEALA